MNINSLALLTFKYTVLDASLLGGYFLQDLSADFHLSLETVGYSHARLNIVEPCR